MKRRFSLFTYPMMDMKAAEAELNRRAAAGWTAEWCRRQLGPAGNRLWRGMRVCAHPERERTETADRENRMGASAGEYIVSDEGRRASDEMWLDEVLSRLEGET